jgi:hypothetical protein
MVNMPLPPNSSKPPAQIIHLVPENQTLNPFTEEETLLPTVPRLPPLQRLPARRQQRQQHRTSLDPSRGQSPARLLLYS